MRTKFKTPQFIRFHEKKLKDFSQHLENVILDAIYIFMRKRRTGGWVNCRKPVWRVNYFSTGNQYVYKFELFQLKRT